MQVKCSGLVCIFLLQYVKIIKGSCSWEKNLVQLARKCTHLLHKRCNYTRLCYDHILNIESWVLPLKMDIEKGNSKIMKCLENLSLDNINAFELLTLEIKMR